MNILMLLQKILGVSFMNYVFEGDGGAGSESGAGADGGSDEGAGAGAGDDKGTGKSDPEKQDNPDNRFTRWKISQAKKEAVKQVIDGGKDPDNNKGTNKDEDFEAYFESKMNEKLKSLGLDKLNKIDEFETKFEKDEFFNQFKEAGTKFAEYGLSIDPAKGGEILADIEANGFTPAQLILLSNADTILSKLNSLPKGAMSTDDGSKANVDTSKMSMMDRINLLKGKHGIH